MFYQVTSNDITSLVNTAGGLIGDFMPIVAVILGVTVAMFIYGKFFHQ